MTRRRGRRRKKLLDDLKDRRGYSHLKEEALDRIMWRNRFGGGFYKVCSKLPFLLFKVSKTKEDRQGPVVRRARVRERLCSD